MKKLTLKQKHFVKEYINRKGNKTQAVLAVYDTKSKINAEQIGRELLEKPHVIEAIDKELNKAGLTVDYVTTQIKNAIDTNLELGKPSQAVGADLLKFTARLHNIIPANKSVNMSYSKKVVEEKSYSEIKELLKSINQTTTKLLQDTA